MDDIELIDPDIIKTLHGITHESHLNELIISMKEEGWIGRPILVIKRNDDYLAWTGTHRIYAARKCGFDSIPCYVIDEAVLNRHGFDAVKGHCFDYERLKILRKVGDEGAMKLMCLETCLI